jgi:GNAT superfamily N-acetyltransferase
VKTHAPGFTPHAVRFAPVTPARWPDVERLFGERGACGGCWCMAWRLPRAEWVRGKGAGNRRALQQLVSSGRRPGVLAYLGKEPIGWCAVAPRTDYSFLARSRTLAAIDATPVWSISCLFVLKPYRRHGLSVALLQAASALAARHGARIVEGYPVEPTMKKTPDAFVWTGLPSAFLKAGFEEVARRSASRPIMRMTVGRLRTQA